MSKAIDKWNNHTFESSCSKTREFNLFSRNVKSFIKRETKTCFELVSFNAGHFYFSGFLMNRVNGKYVYFSCSDVRYFKNEWYNNLLVRTAKDSKDYTGGTNNTCSIKKINDVSMSLSQ